MMSWQPAWTCHRDPMPMLTGARPETGFYVGRALRIFEHAGKDRCAAFFPSHQTETSIGIRSSERERIRVKERGENLEERPRNRHN